MRRLLKWFGWLLLLICIPIIGFWGYNQIDDEPSRDAIRLGHPFEQHVIDQNNAWIFLLGIDAAPEEDPLTLGRWRLDTFLARVRQVPVSEPSEAEIALRKPRVPFLGPEEVPESLGAFCPALTDDCISRSGEHRAALKRLEEENRLLLSNYRRALALPEYEELSQPHLELLLPDLRIDELYRNLLMLGIYEDRTDVEVMSDLALAGFFWRRASAGSRTLVGKLVAQRRTTDYQKLLVDLLDHADPNNRDGVGAMIEDLLAPPSSDERMLDPAARFEYQTLVATFEDWRAQEHPGLGCVTDFKQCTELWMREFFLPQATYNIAASNWAVIENVWQAPASKYLDVNKELGQQIADRMPLSEGSSDFQYFLKNFPGKTLAAIAVPAYLKFVDRIHDQEAFRRMLFLKYRALSERIAPEAMDGWLRSRPEVDHNPFTSAPFDWDSERSELYFFPHSSHWGSDRIAVAIGF